MAKTSQRGVRALSVGRRWIGWFCLLGGTLLLNSCTTLPSHFYDLTNHSTVATGNLIQRIGSRRVIFIGEAHDSKVDHLVQLEVIRQLHESGRKVVIGLEVFPAKLQQTLNAWSNGHISEAHLVEAYRSNWTLPYEYYADIFRYARDQQIKLLGLNLTRHKIRTILNKGVESEPPETLRRINFSRCEQEPDYTAFMRSYWGGLGHRLAFDRMCDSQRYKEAFMAYRISQQLEQPESTVVVLVGSLHALKNAIPQMLRRHGWDNHLVMTTGRLSTLTGAPITESQGDLVWH